MRSVFLMHMENVDSESVSLLERPVAEVAGELPVALIHTARVFQVFVSVVLISEHFTTAITLETLSRIWNEEISKYITLYSHITNDRTCGTINLFIQRIIGYTFALYAHIPSAGSGSLSSINSLRVRGMPRNCT